MGWQDGAPVQDAAAAPPSVPTWQQGKPAAEPDFTPLREQIRKNLLAAGASDEAASAAGEMGEFGIQHALAVGAEAAKPAGPEFTPAQRKIIDQGYAAVRPSGAKPARSFDDALSAGLQISVSGLLARGKAPTAVLAEDAPMASRIAANVATVAGDLPFMLAGAVLGGGAGAPTGPGAAVTAGAGAFGLPAGLRATLMDAYENGDFKSFGDFWERASGIIWQEVKGEITGAATVASGGAARVATAAAPAAVRTLAPTAAEIATMTSVGRALDGEVPSAQDFVDAAIVLGGFKAVGAATDLAAKLRQTYAKTGATPREVMDLAAKDPTILQDLAAENREVPASLGAAAQPTAKVLPDGTVVAEGGGAGTGEPPAAAAAGAASPEPTPQKAVLDRVSVGEHQAKGYDFQRFYADMKDELYPIKAITDELAGGQKLDVAMDPYKLARLTRGLSGKAEQFINLAPFDFKTYENVGKPLRAIVDPVKDDLDGLRAFAVAKRALELDGRDIATGVPIEEARQVVRSGDAKYGKVFRDLVDYQDHLVRYLSDAGVLDKDALATMREANRDYVPFFRLMDTEKKGGAGPGMSVRSPVKGIKGSERRIIDPLESIVKNTYLFTTLAERNAVGRALIDLAEKSGRDDLVKKIAAPSKPVTVQAKEVQDFLDAHGIEGNAEAFDIFRRGFLNPAEDEIVVFREGKREIYQVPRDVAGAFKATDRETAGLLVRMLAIPAKTLRAGATLTPDFFLRNFNRDQLSAAVFSNSGYLPVIDFVRGFLSVAKEDKAYQAWLKSGGANATMLSMDRQYLQAKVNEIADIQSVREKVWNTVKFPIEALRITSELVENATRVGEFKRAMAGDFSKAAIQRAGFDSREVTLDFARIGAKTRSMNMITAFWNAQVEGLDRAARAFKDNPLATTLKVGGFITLPSILLWWANHDDPRWKQIPDWERDLFWIVMTDEHIYRIPKPFELGVLFGSFPERMLDKYVDEKPDAMHNIGKSLANVFGFNVTPTFALPLLEHVTNHSFFTDRPLVPDNMEKLLPEYQYSTYTTEATKALGQIIGTMPGMHDASIASPMVIDNYIRGWSGSLGVYAVQVADAALRKAGVLPDRVKPTPTLADIPVIKAFVVRYPSAQAQSIQDFYDHYAESQQVVDTVRYLAKQGEAEAAMREARMDPAKLIKLDNIHAALGNAQRVIQMIDKNPTMEADEKRQLIDGTYMQMIQMATDGEKTLRALRREIAPVKQDEAKKASPESALAAR